VPLLDVECELDIVVGDWRSWLMMQRTGINQGIAIAKLVVFIAQRKRVII
jgi:hypothetical protein